MNISNELKEKFNKEFNEVNFLLALSEDIIDYLEIVHKNKTEHTSELTNYKEKVRNILIDKYGIYVKNSNNSFLRLLWKQVIPGTYYPPKASIIDQEEKKTKHNENIIINLDQIKSLIEGI